MESVHEELLEAPSLSPFVAAGMQRDVVVLSSRRICIAHHDGLGARSRAERAPAVAGAGAPAAKPGKELRAMVASLKRKAGAAAAPRAGPGKRKKKGGAGAGAAGA
jgi:hypothetical protein